MLQEKRNVNNVIYNKDNSEKNINKFSVVISLILSIFTVISFYIQLTYNEGVPHFSIGGWGMPQFILVCVFTCLYQRFYWNNSNKIEEKLKKWMYFLSGILSFCWLLGKSYQTYNEWTLFGGGISG